jgi:hypothetical protein
LQDAPLDLSKKADIWEFMKANHLAVESLDSKIASAQSPEQLRDALGRPAAGAMFGRY